MVFQARGRHAHSMRTACARHARRMRAAWAWGMGHGACAWAWAWAWGMGMGHGAWAWAWAWAWAGGEVRRLEVRCDGWSSRCDGWCMELQPGCSRTLAAPGMDAARVICDGARARGEKACRHHTLLRPQPLRRLAPLVPLSVNRVLGAAPGLGTLGDFDAQTPRAAIAGYTSVSAASSQPKAARR